MCLGRGDLSPTPPVPDGWPLADHHKTLRHSRQAYPSVMLFLISKYL